MDKVDVSRNGQSNQFSVVLTEGGDTIRCMVSVSETEAMQQDAGSAMYRAALSRAKALAKTLDAAIEGS